MSTTSLASDAASDPGGPGGESRPESGAEAAFAQARQVADAVLYEGYVLYPYRSSSSKNQVRFQFGVIAPKACCDAGATEAWAAQVECIADTRPGHRIVARLRFLHPQVRSIDVLTASGDHEPAHEIDTGTARWSSWDEAVKRELDVTVDVAAEPTEVVLPIQLLGSREEEPLVHADGPTVGRAVRIRNPLTAQLRVAVEPIDGPFGLVKVRARVENHTPWKGLTTKRDEVVRQALVAVHVLLYADGGEFVSPLDPPEFAKYAVESCQHQGLWPVLAAPDGTRRVLMGSPIILYDHPEIAPESQVAMFDATEIDEILALRVMTLTDEEKREARGTDPRSAEIIDRIDTMPPEIFERLHGAVRALRPHRGDPLDEGQADPLPVPGGAGGMEPWADLAAGDMPDGAGPAGGAHGLLDEHQRELLERAADELPAIGGPTAAPWWSEAADRSVDPWSDSTLIEGVLIQKGSRVRLRPSHRADAHDIFLVDRTAVVEGVFLDVDGDTHLAVTLEDDPASEEFSWHGRYLYFHPDEIQPLGDQ